MFLNKFQHVPVNGCLISCSLDAPVQRITGFFLSSGPDFEILICKYNSLQISKTRNEDVSDQGYLAARELDFLCQHTFQKVLHEEYSQYLLHGLVMYCLVLRKTKIL
jgi:hypothetical protein